jgi:putative restriction endonuclease
MKPSLLYYFARDSLASYTEDFNITDRKNPVQFQMNGRSYSVRISYVHDSGKERPNADEVRIQIGRTSIDEQRTRASTGVATAFIGFFEGGDVFVAWDPQHVYALEAVTNASVYARISQRPAVLANGAAIHQFNSNKLGSETMAIAMHSGALGFYLENIAAFHKFDTVQDIRKVLSIAAGAQSMRNFGQVGSVVSTASGHRKRFIYQRRVYPRDPQFTENVLSAYGRRCCVCGRQMGLVQAAHIIPHSRPESSNSVQNGLALCVEHHKLYDDGLLMPGPGGKLVFNATRAAFLRATKQSAGLDELQERVGDSYAVPHAAKLRPSEDLLRQGIALRKDNS